MQDQKELKKYINREISWLKFNMRVLEESQDANVPLLERLRFLGIYSNNLDEFYKVRYATVQRAIQLNSDGYNNIIEDQSEENLLTQINEEVARQQIIYDQLYEDLLKDLEKENIHLLRDMSDLAPVHAEYMKSYFQDKLSHTIVVLLLEPDHDFPELRDGRFYLAVKMKKGEKTNYAIIDVPTNIFPRFVVLPSINFKSYIVYLEDIIRFHLDEIFKTFDYDEIEAHSIKITRDAQLSEDQDVQRSFVDEIARSVEKRKKGAPVRMIYDRDLSPDTLEFLKDHLDFDDYDSLVPGSRYHNKKDFMNFPPLDRKDLEYQKIKPLVPKKLQNVTSYFDAISKEDHLLYLPYHDFSIFLKFLREAAIDPKVKKIYITIYRAARNSQVMSALINAARNGKEVIAVLELRARFDEENNVHWSKTLQEAGVKVVFGIRGLKVHSKIVLIERQEDDGMKQYAVISTGNFHEGTSALYTDYLLFTSNKSITKEIRQVFDFILVNYLIKPYKQLLVSPLEARGKLLQLIDQEIANAKNKLESGINIKVNSLCDKEFIDKLYEASAAGVPIKLVVRGICSILPQVKGLSDNIEATSVVDKFLEHPRLFWFKNGGDDKVYISSSDIMPRNLNGRVEVSVPILDNSLKQEIMDVFMLSFLDNVKGRPHNIESSNIKLLDNNQEREKNRSQEKILDYYTT